MKRNLLKTILIIGIFTVFGAVSANAQTDLKGSYIYKVKEDDISYSFTLKFEGKDAVYYSHEGDGYGTLKGEWSVENEIIRVYIEDNDRQLMFKFKQEGDDLVVTETLHHSIVDAGAVFKKDDSKPAGAELKPEAIGKKVMKLIKSIKTEKDISSANLEKQIGMKVFFNEKNPKNFGVRGKVAGAPNWLYSFATEIYEFKDKEKPSALKFDLFNQREESVKPDMTPVCRAFNFDTFSKELQKAGFSAPKPRVGVHDAWKGWSFNRDEAEVLMIVDHKCIKSIIISFTD